MTAPPSGLGRRTVTGTPFETGLALGLAGRDAVHRAVVPSALWQRVTAPAEAPAIARMDQATRALFPAVHDELRGLAEGLDLPFQQVLAWNARGDLLAGAGEGCTTVMAPGRTPVIAHNEDGLPTLRGACFLAELQPAKHPRVMSFCYPGSIPGHSFAVTAAGLVITVNNLRLTGIAAEIPRMVLTRALLAAPDRAAAVALLRAAPPSGGFHLALGQAGEGDIWSVSFGGGDVVCVTRRMPAVHSNHALVEGAALSRQIVTASSHDRLLRGRTLVAAGATPLDILRDTGGEGLPILRGAPDDPDDENTIAQFQASIGATGIDWQVHMPGQPTPACRGVMPVSPGPDDA